MRSVKSWVFICLLCGRTSHATSQARRLKTASLQTSLLKPTVMDRSRSFFSRWMGGNQLVKTASLPGFSRDTLHWGACSCFDRLVQCLPRKLTFPLLVERLTSLGSTQESQTTVLLGLSSDQFPPDYSQISSPRTIVRSVPSGLSSDQFHQDYRQISFLSCVGKVYKGILKDLLLQETESAIHSSQHGFMKSRSTVTALMHVVQSWQIAVDANLMSTPPSLISHRPLTLSNMDNFYTL